MFKWLWGENKPKRQVKRKHTFVCKHCKHTCEGCETLYCYACYANTGNPCPVCGKTNLQEKEK